jgi:histidinol phosphatase-like enzyme
LDGKTAMSIKAAILDLDGTTIAPDGSVVEGMNEAVGRLHELDVKVIIFSNRPTQEGLLKIQSMATSPDLFVTKQHTKVSKGSPKWIQYVCDKLGIKPNELIYLGDSDLDMRTAVNSKVVYLNAQWSKPSFPYGIQLSSPALLPTIIEHFFLKTALWHWRLDTVDAAKRSVVAKSMIDGDAAGISDLRYKLLGWTKHGISSAVGPFSLSTFVMLHLLASIYLDELYECADWWTTYPGSSGGVNPAMQDFLEIAAKLFHDRFVPDLLVRHAQAKDSGETRAKGGSVDFINQVCTVRLNYDPSIISGVGGKNVLLVDDFITEGHSIEWARNLLLQAGAASIVSVSIAKYGPRFWSEAPKSGSEFDPFSPVHLNMSHFRTIQHLGALDSEALRCFRESYSSVVKMHTSQIV